MTYLYCGKYFSNIDLLRLYVLASLMDKAGVKYQLFCDQLNENVKCELMSDIKFKDDDVIAFVQADKQFIDQNFRIQKKLLFTKISSYNNTLLFDFEDNINYANQIKTLDLLFFCTEEILQNICSKKKTQQPNNKATLCLCNGINNVLADEDLKKNNRFLIDIQDTLSNFAEQLLNCSFIYTDCLDGIALAIALNKKMKFYFSQDKNEFNILKNIFSYLNMSIFGKITKIDINYILQQIENSKNTLIEKFTDISNNISSFTLIQCLYGTDEEKYIATIKALQHMLRSDPMPVEWIFVEAQKKKDEAKFKWLSEYGIKYKFVKIGKNNNNVFLKCCLQKTAAAISKCRNLAFVDSDCWFKNKNWVYDIEDAFEKFDIFSLATEYINDKTPIEHILSVGAKWQKINTDIQNFSSIKDQHIEFGYCGYTFGIKKQIFENISKNKINTDFDNICLWSNVFLNNKLYYNNKIPFKKIPIKKYIDMLSIGGADGECVHVDYNEKLQNQYFQALDKLQTETIQVINDIKVV